MKRFLVILLLWPTLAFGAFTEFYCQTTASNLNAGSTTSDAAAYTGVGDSDGTSVFTPSDGSTPASTVSVGDFGSVYVTSGATVATFIGRITTVAAGVNGAVTFSATAKSGTFPSASAGAHTITLKTGGAWKGPNAAVSFPFGFITNAQTNAAGNPYRVNGKSGTNYSITAAMTHANAGPGRFQGYTTTPGDEGQWVIDGGTTGTSYVLLTQNGVNCDFVNLTFQNNGATGSANGVTANNGTKSMWRRCVFANVRGNGVLAANSPHFFIECEAYGCNQSNTANTAGFGATAISSNSQSVFRGCISHDNTGSSSRGFYLGSGNVVIGCIADTNGASGFELTNAVGTYISASDAYNNTGDGIRLSNATAALFFIENCNLIKNGGWGINGSGAGSRNGAAGNCAVGAGTQANTSGTTTGLSAIYESGTVTYASNVTPWVDPANGDFRINLAAAKGAGRGAFTQTAASYSGTVGYPDIGAAQHQETAAPQTARIYGE